jgi:hypothetical protein
VTADGERACRRRSTRVPVEPNGGGAVVSRAAMIWILGHVVVFVLLLFDLAELVRRWAAGAAEGKADDEEAMVVVNVRLKRRRRSMLMGIMAGDDRC